MSFTLRNLFSEDDGDSNAEWTDGSPEMGGRDTSPVESAKAPENGTPYLVSEVLPFIPTAIVASEDIPMEKEVVIPMLRDGSTDVTLSSIFRVCPELFDAEITPLNDSVVTLPKKAEPVKEAAAAGEPLFEATGTPFGAPGFGPPEAEAAETPDESEDNPFWSPESNDVGESKSVAPEAAFPSGFSDALPAEVSQKDEGASKEEPPAPEKKPKKTIDEAMAGFENPPAPKSGNPFGEPADSGSSGFSANPFDSNESFSTLFSDKADEDSDIPFPSGEADDSTWGAMFDSDSESGDEETSNAGAQGFGEMMQSSEAKEETKEKSKPAETPTDSDFPKDPFAAPTSDPSAEKASAKPSPSISFSVEKPAPNKAPVPAAEEVAPVKEAAPFAAPVAKAAPVDEAAPAEEAAPPAGDKAFRPLRDESAAAAPAASQVRVEEEQLAPAAPPMPGEMEIDLSNLEFRALFSSDESFTLAKVAREVVTFDGVSACALATTVKLVQASRNEQSRLGDEAREMVDAIRNLAKLTGLPEARAFTLQTDRGTVSLFLEGDCCVTVNHTASGFGPGVREKLILIARNIHKLQE
ncbi:MAG: hypothetical protein AAGF67_06760 [Verrucomicrobiota bacterium]